MELEYMIEEIMCTKYAEFLGPPWIATQGGNQPAGGRKDKQNDEGKIQGWRNRWKPLELSYSLRTIHGSRRPCVIPFTKAPTDLSGRSPGKKPERPMVRMKKDGEIDNMDVKLVEHERK
ncbi:hypothetical protein Nepgr_019138 [Nepenthes gracilis]|uniref:Uncharacterized protein n=1 Tax=Nepenthes gracilis TaxID=150966 RepID=A0AAD3SVA7_NEPGR|nr:hypothetical protein Nepgr_019138 [Nepenthes gracilis]